MARSDYGLYRAPGGYLSLLHGWRTLLDLDFTAEQTQSLSTDTNYTVGGKTWTKENSAGDATAMAITNGTGLVITPASSKDLGAGTRTSPILRAKLSDLLAAWDPAWALRVWFMSSGNYGSTNYDMSRVFVATDTSQNTIWAPKIEHFQDGVTRKWNVQYDRAGIETVGTTQNRSGSEDVAVLDLPDGLMSERFRGLVGTSSGGNFPAANTLRPIEMFDRAVGINLTSNHTTAANYCVGVTAGRIGSGSDGFALTVQRIKIEYR